MRATVHVIPCVGILADAGRSSDGRNNGTGIATAALRTAERLEAPADLVLIAVPAGTGQAVADRLVARDRGPAAPPSRPRSALGDELDDVDETITGRDAATPARGRNRRAEVDA
jgi:hypothetical protein